MKKLLAAALAAFMIVSLAACAKAPAQPEPQPEASAAEPAQPSAQTEPAPDSSDDNVVHITPNQSPSNAEDTADWLDEPETVQLDLEEVVSCCYTLPHLTLSSQEATDAANAAFEQLSQNFQTYAHETVYPDAQAKQAMGFVNGGYSVEPADGALLIHYTLSVSYSTESSDTRLKHDYRVDLSTGAVTQLDES